MMHGVGDGMIIQNTSIPSNSFSLSSLPVLWRKRWPLAVWFAAAWLAAAAGGGPA